MSGDLYSILMVVIFAAWIIVISIAFISFIVRTKKKVITSHKKRFIFKMLLITIIVVSIYISLVSGFLPNLWNNKITRLLPYDFVIQFLCYDHIVYNGEHYYLLGDYDIPDEFIPFSSESIYVTIVDGEGKPFDESRKEEAWTYVGDDEMIYIYFGSAKYTKNKSLFTKYFQ